MRFTKPFCALLSSLAVTAVAQTPPPAETTPNADEARLRDALRKALQAEEPAESSLLDVGITRTVTGDAVPSFNFRPFPPPGGPAVTTNAAGARVVRLSLRQAIELALENNLQLQVERYTPIVSEYVRRSTYGYYDPAFTGQIGRSHVERESGGFNTVTGQAFPGATTDTDFYSAGLGGWLPTGMRYDFNHDVNRIDATSPFLITSTNLPVPVFGERRTLTYNAQAGVSATQPLLRNFWIDAQRLRIKQARRDVRINELAYERTVGDVINRVEQAYYALIAAHELVRVYEASVAVNRQLYDENRRRVEVGNMAPLDMQLAHAQLAGAEILLLSGRNEVANQEAILKSLIHDSFISQLGLHLELTDKLEAVPVSLEVFDAFREAVENRPDLHAERVRLERQQIALKYNFNQLFPSLDLFGTYGANGLDRRLGGTLEDIRRRDYPQYSYGLALSFPLTFQAERNNYKAAKATVEQQILIFKQLEELVLLEVETQVRLLRTAWNHIPLRREQTTYQQAALEAEKRRVDAGVATSFNVLQIAEALTRAQADEIGTLREYNQALAELAFRKGTTLDRWRIDRPARAKDEAK